MISHNDVVLMEKIVLIALNNGLSAESAIRKYIHENEGSAVGARRRFLFGTVQHWVERRLKQKQKKASSKESFITPAMRLGAIAADFHHHKVLGEDY